MRTLCANISETPFFRFLGKRRIIISLAKSKLRFCVSILRQGNCYDNAVAESFFHLLKSERIRRKTYATRKEARQDVFDYIELFYNPKRKHGRNGMLSPIDYERQEKMKLQSV